jgi:mediator of RNA polymerase II transcription subunit 6
METVHPLEAYFIMNNRIYRSPDVYGILSNRLVSSHSFLAVSFTYFLL